jgi:hypothetical protein
VIAIALLTLAGCASSSLPYTPEVQPAGARVSAGYQVTGDRVRVELNTDKKRLEEAVVIRADGTVVRAVTIENPPVVPSGSAVGFGLGVGGGSFGGGSGVGVGSGVSVGLPVGGGSSSVEGNTFVSFPLDQAGPAPWRVSVKLTGVNPFIINVGGPAPR